MKRFMLLSVVLFTINILHSQWLPDTRLTNEPSDSYTPINNARCIAADGNMIYVTWTDERDGNGEIYFKRSSDGGMSWGVETRLTNNTAYSGAPTIALVGSLIHIAWHDERDGNKEIYYKRSEDGGMTWGSDTRMSNDSGDSGFPSLAATGSTVHLGWRDDRHGINEIYYKRSIDDGLNWTADIRLTNDPGNSFNTAMAVSGSNVHVAWQEGRNGNFEIYYKRSTDGGMTWGSDTRLTNDGNISEYPAISTSGMLVHLVYADNREGNFEIYSRRSSNGGMTWGAETRMTTNDADSDRPSVISDGSFVHMAWHDEHVGNWEIYYRRSRDGGLTWNKATRLTGSLEASTQPSITVSGKSVHLVWIDERDGNLEIYYNQNPTGNMIGGENTLLWAKRFGASIEDLALAIEVDAFGNVYTTGSFEGTVDFNPGTGTANLTSFGDADIFVLKLDAAGNFVWARKMGGTGYEEASSISVDQMGNVYTAGNFYSTADFDPGTGTTELTPFGDADVFVSKLDASGNFVWIRQLGGTNYDEVREMALDASGNVITTGHFFGTADFDPGAGVVNFSSSGNEDLFISKLNSEGNFIWARKAGGPGTDEGRGIASDASDNVYTTGTFSGTVDFDPGAGITNLISGGSIDVFVYKLDASGNLVWARKFGGGSEDQGNSIHADAMGNVYTTGFFKSAVDFDPGAGNEILTSEGLEDVFVSKLNSSGDFVWAKRMGGAGIEKANSVITDIKGNVYTTGYFDGSSDFNPGAANAFIESVDQLDAFISKLNAAGDFVWINQIGGPDEDRASELVVDALFNVNVTGSYKGTADFDPGEGVTSLTSAGNADGYIVKLMQCLSTSATISVTACNSYTSPSSAFIWAASGTYLDTIFNTAGCDSVITVNLTVVYSSASEISTTACESFTSPSGTHIWTTSGIYLDTITNAAGCDSVMTINLTIVHNSASIISVTACDSFTSPSGANTWTTSGTYMDIIPNAAGCDSMMTVDLTILHSSTSVITESACDSYISPSGTNTWTTSGTYMDIIPNAAGCDSVITVNLTIVYSSAAVIFVSACDSYISPSGSQTWTVSGTYTDIIPNASGCDSVMTVNLTIHTVDASLTQNGSMLTAQMAGAAYQWIDCNNGNQPISGENAQSFTATVNGSYAVIVTANGCADTSLCFTVTIVGTVDIPVSAAMKIYPNPAGQFLTIDPDEAFSDGWLKLTDVYGHAVYRMQYQGSNPITIELVGPAGIYFVTLTTFDKRTVAKLVKK